MPFTRPRHWLRWLIGSVVVLAVLAVTGPFIYIHFFNGSAPAALSLPSASATASGSEHPSASTVSGQRTGGRHLDRRLRLHRRLPGQREPARAERHGRRPHHLGLRCTW